MLPKKWFSASTSDIVSVSLVSVAVGMLSAWFALLLKHATEFTEEHFLHLCLEHPSGFLALPVIGLMLIWLLRTVFFRKKPNKGISEVFESLGPGKKLPSYKISSHFFNGLITVACGGSTGVEVSTVVATAAIGSEVHKNQTFFRKYRRELMCAGIAAGVASLFNSPLAGIFFCLEVISRKRPPLLLVATGASTGAALLLGILVSEPRLIPEGAEYWNYHALPFFILLALLTALISVGLTKTVLFFKKLGGRFTHDGFRIISGALLLGVLLLLLPGLYGDSYHSLTSLLHTSKPLTLTALLGVGLLILIKPFAVSITLASGGDGGVFAPSLVIGGLTGLLMAIIGNQYFGLDLIPLNFMLVGMGAALSAAIHAPLTSAALVCGLSGNYVLVLPLLLASFISEKTARKLLPYNVYTYKPA